MAKAREPSSRRADLSLYAVLVALGLLIALAPIATAAIVVGILTLSWIADLFQKARWERRRIAARDPFFAGYAGKRLVVATRRRGWEPFVLNSIAPALREDERIVWAEDEAWWSDDGLFLEAELRRTAIGRVRPGEGFHRYGKLPLWIEVGEGRLRVRSLHQELRALKESGSRRESVATTDVRALLERVRAGA